MAGCIFIGLWFYSGQRTMHTDVHRITLKDSDGDAWNALSEDDKKNYSVAEVWKKDDPPADGSAAPPPGLVAPEDTGMYRLFNPLFTREDLTVTRPQMPASAAPAGGGE
jgi:hypothetical protein